MWLYFLFSTWFKRLICLKKQKQTNKKLWRKLEPIRKDFLQLKTKKKKTMRWVEGVDLWYSQIPNSPGAWPTNWRVIIFQRFSQRNESSEPQVRPLNPQVQMSPQSIWLWKTSRAYFRESQRPGEIETQLLKGSHKISHVLGPEAEAVISREPGLDLPAGSQRVS